MRDIKAEVDARFEKVVNPAEWDVLNFGLQVMPKLPDGYYDKPLVQVSTPERLTTDKYPTYEQAEAALVKMLEHFSGKVIYWRTLPMIEHQRDFDSMKTDYRGFARFNWI